MSSFLETIMQQRRNEVLRLKSSIDYELLRKNARQRRTLGESFRLSAAIGENGRTNVITEIKRASPSKGVINDNADVVEIARNYDQGGAAAISVLTEPNYFHGSLSDLQNVVSAVSIPVLRKDFTVDELQIYEAALAGADAILLIVAGLDPAVLGALFECSQELGLDALIEVHNEKELEVAASLGPKLIGINNRDLNTLDVSLETSRCLIKCLPDDVLMISESGIRSADELEELRSLGFDGFLVGESLMRENNSTEILRSWTSASHL